MIPKIAQWHFGTLDVISLSTSVGSENEQFDCLHWLDGSRSRCNTTQAKVSRPSIAVEVGQELSEVECHDVPRGRERLWFTQGTPSHCILCVVATDDIDQSYRF